MVKITYEQLRNSLEFLRSEVGRLMDEMGEPTPRSKAMEEREIAGEFIKAAHDQAGVELL